MKIEHVLFPSVFFKITNPFDGRSFLMCSHDPFFGTNKNRILDSRENCSNFCLGIMEAPFLHVFDPNSPSIYVKCPRKCQKTYNFDIFLHFPNFTPLPLLNFG